MPDLYILTGANGAGKSTTGVAYLPSQLKEYQIFDGDKLFAEKRKQIYKIQTLSLKEAGRLSTEWLHQYFEHCVLNAINKNDHFIYEGHLPEEENWITPKRFKSAGYNIHVLFFGLANPGISEQRVLIRAKEGGHNVPPYEIERNFYGNLLQLNKHYGLIDELKIIDTSDSKPKVVAILNENKVIEALTV